MQYRIHGQGVKITASLKRETERHLRFALSRFSPSIEQVGVRLIDVNGPRGGVDKRCRIVVTMKDADTIVVEAEDARMNAAISAAADRMGRTVARAVRRRREDGQRAGLYEFGETPPQPASEPEARTPAERSASDELRTHEDGDTGRR